MVELITHSSQLHTITDITRLHLNTEGGLEKQSKAASLLQRFCDFFSSFTSSGRAEIASRNDRIYSTMRGLVEAEQVEERARLHSTEGPVYRLEHLDANRSFKSQLTDILNASEDPHIRQMIQHCISWGEVFDAQGQSVGSQIPQSAVDELKGRIETYLLRQDSQTRFEAIRDNFHDAVQETSARTCCDIRNHLLRMVGRAVQGDRAEGIRTALETYTDKALAASEPVSLKAFFTGITKLYATLVKPYDERLLGRAMQHSLDRQIAEFCKPSQQQMMQEGIHSVFDVDISRHLVAQIGDHVIDCSRPAEANKNILRDFVGEKHANMLPFVSMMASQGGFFGDGMQIDQDLGHISDADLGNAELVYGAPVLHNTLTKDANGDILITMDSTKAIQTPLQMGADGKEQAPVTLNEHHMNVTLRVKVNEDPKIRQIAGANVVVPRFSVEKLTVRSTL